MAKPKTKSPAARIFGGLFHTKAGFFVILGLIGLIITAVDSAYLPNLFSQLFQTAIGPLISIAILVVGLKYVIGAIKKMF